MHSKIFLPGFLSMVALTGTVLMATIAPGSACPFSNKSGLSDSPQSSSPSSLTGNSVNFNQPDIHKLGIAAAGLAGIFGLWGGSMLLKARAAKREHPMVDPSAAEAIVEYSTFPIEVPAEALQQADDAEVADAQTSALR